MSVEQGSIWMSKPGYPTKYLKVVHIEHPSAWVARCTYIPNPTATSGLLTNVFDMHVHDLKTAFIPCTDAAKVLYGE